MIALKLMRRLSRLEEEYGKLWKELETPLSHEIRYYRNLAHLKKHFREAAEREASAIDKTSEPES